MVLVQDYCGLNLSKYVYADLRYNKISPDNVVRFTRLFIAEAYKLNELTTKFKFQQVVLLPLESRQVLADQVCVQDSVHE